MPRIETDRAKITKRLEGDGWVNVGGAKHDKYVRDGLPSIQVPRHRTLTPGVARSIAKAAGWIK